MTTRTSRPSVRWISPPGATNADMLEEALLTQADLATRLDLSITQVTKLMSGEAPISDDLAITLARVLGSTAKFWLNREADYRAALVRLDTPS